jgi:hypothetical protein
MIAKTVNQQTICYAFTAYKTGLFVIGRYFISVDYFCSSFNLASISVDMVIKLAQVCLITAISTLSFR